MYSFTFWISRGRTSVLERASLKRFCSRSSVMSLHMVAMLVPPNADAADFREWIAAFASWSFLVSRACLILDSRLGRFFSKIEKVSMIRSGELIELMLFRSFKIRSSTIEFTFIDIGDEWRVAGWFVFIHLLRTSFKIPLVNGLLM